MTDNKLKQDVLMEFIRPPENEADDDEKNLASKKIEIEIETEVERDNWIPDGGWGWGVVAGAVIIHVYIGKAFGVYSKTLAQCKDLIPNKVNFLSILYFFWRFTVNRVTVFRTKRQSIVCSRIPGSI